jgi:hypothetical protein
MDSLLTSAARLLAAGDPLGALKRIALRDDAPALAFRGIGMAQLGEYARARQLLRRAARRFGARERLAQARCQVAEAEVALAARDLTLPFMHGSSPHDAICCSEKSRRPKKRSRRSIEPYPQSSHPCSPGPNSPGPNSRCGECVSLMPRPPWIEPMPPHGRRASRR